MYNIENYFGLFIPSFLIISGLFLIFTSIQKKLPLSITWFAILILSSGNMLLVSYLQTSHPSTLLLFTVLALSLSIVISFYFSISKKFNIEINIISFLLTTFITIILLVYFSKIKKDSTLKISENDTINPDTINKTIRVISKNGAKQSDKNLKLKKSDNDTKNKQNKFTVQGYTKLSEAR